VGRVSIIQTENFSQHEAWLEQMCIQNPPHQMFLPLLPLFCHWEVLFLGWLHRCTPRTYDPVIQSFLPRKSSNLGDWGPNWKGWQRGQGMLAPRKNIGFGSVSKRSSRHRRPLTWRPAIWAAGCFCADRVEGAVGDTLHRHEAPKPCAAIHTEDHIY